MGAGRPVRRGTFQTLYVVTKRKHFANPCFISQFYSKGWLWRMAPKLDFANSSVNVSCAPPVGAPPRVEWLL
jgi:hypothetical protein